MYEANSFGCNVLQLFTKNATTWKERKLSQEEIDLFNKTKSEKGIKKIASHASYLINPATFDGKKHKLSSAALQHELLRSTMLGINFVVLHPGSHMGQGEGKGIIRIADTINEILDNTTGITTRLLLETTAGQGSSIGHRFEQISSILDRITQREKTGVCLDTCHIFAAGYDIRTVSEYNKTIERFDSIIGLKHLYLVHLNDSKKKLGSRVDRHEHIGLGLIGKKAFELFMNDKRFFNIPKIIETPKKKDGKDWDRVNLELLRSMIYPNE